MSIMIDCVLRKSSKSTIFCGSIIRFKTASSLRISSSSCRQASSLRLHVFHSHLGETPGQNRLRVKSARVLVWGIFNTAPGPACIPDPDDNWKLRGWNGMDGHGMPFSCNFARQSPILPCSISIFWARSWWEIMRSGGMEARFSIEIVADLLTSQSFSESSFHQS